MKKLLIVAPIALFTVFTSCESEAKSEVAEIAVVAEIVSKEYTLNILESTIAWKGEGATHGQAGNLLASSGNFTIENNNVVAGTVEIDMTSLTVSSIPAEEVEDNAKLVSHLTTGDFFDVTAFPTATLTITDGSDMNNVKANITIKDVTEEITFALSSAEENGIITLTSSLKIDRTKFGVTFNSGNFFENLGDHLINDEFTLDISLVSK